TDGAFGSALCAPAPGRPGAAGPKSSSASSHESPPERARYRSTVSETRTTHSRPDRCSTSVSRSCPGGMITATFRFIRWNSPRRCCGTVASRQSRPLARVYRQKRPGWLAGSERIDSSLQYIYMIYIMQIYAIHDVRHPGPPEPRSDVGLRHPEGGRIEHRLLLERELRPDLSSAARPQGTGLDPPPPGLPRGGPGAPGLRDHGAREGSVRAVAEGARAER